jgi:GNAT superfamily N-acetyltransferase
VCAVPPDVESAEIAAFTDAMRASPEVCEIAEIGGATCLAMRSTDSRMFNRVLALQSTEPLDEIASFYGETSWWIGDAHGLGPELEARGFVRDYGWMKFTRGVGPREARSDLHVVRIGPDGADDFARVIVGSFGLPESAKPLPANVVGRPGWSCFVAYEGDAPAGAGAVFVHEGTGWLGMAGTLPAFRSRGAQSALLAARIEAARLQGCSVVITETGELEQGRPSASYRNILRAGFREAGVRPNYRSG